MSIELRDFVDTGIKVSAIGFGAGQIGNLSMGEEEINKLLNVTLDCGINLIDTARGYGNSEERIGRHISHRRKEYVLSTKIGYGIEGYQDWTYDCITVGIEAALQRLRTDYIDIVHFHSCSLEILQNTDVIEALSKAVEAGKVRVAAYSGENEALEYAISTNKFKSIMTSVNICDQRVMDVVIDKAKKNSIAIIAKRPLANVAWKYKERPYENYCEEYWLRLQKMNLQFDMDWVELALRFAAFTDGVHSCIVGTTNLEHIKRNIEILKKGALSSDTISLIKTTFKSNDDNWFGQV